MIAAALLTTAVLISGPAASTDAERQARAFLELLLSNPGGTTSLMTSDGMMVAGDIGGPFAEFLAKQHPKAGWLGACTVGQLRPSPEKSSELSADKDPPPWLKGGNLMVVEGSMSCTQTTGKKSDLRVMVVLKDDKVAMFGLDRAR